MSQSHSLTQRYAYANRVIGAAICKAAKLPYLPLTTASRMGAIGGPFAAMACIPPTLATILFCATLNERFRQQGIRSGRLAHRCRRSGHFPDILLLIPLVFLDCLLGGLIGHEIFAPRPVFRREVVQMATLGGLMVAPIFPIVFFFLLGLLEALWQLVRELSQGYPASESLLLLPYLWGQFSALKRLLGHLAGRNSGSASAPTTAV